MTTKALLADVPEDRFFQSVCSILFWTASIMAVMKKMTAL